MSSHLKNDLLVFEGDEITMPVALKFALSFGQFKKVLLSLFNFRLVLVPEALQLSLRSVVAFILVVCLF